MVHSLLYMMMQNKFQDLFGHTIYNYYIWIINNKQTNTRTMSYIITRANENNKVGKMGKGRKISHVQTIVVGGDERSKCRPVYRVTLIHKNNK